ncbi:MAG TPA: hypothetical protein VIA18_00135 [Polyangia bacterium]|jgi:hypothetical protein|nr:hypothetical protein [Polyangia bacterium]HWE28003.1 hypothetical protein [Polyangia bacterium]
MQDWGDFTLNITVMPPEPASDLASGADDELLPTQPFRKPTLAQLKPKAAPPKPKSQPLPLRTGTLHSVAGLPLPRMESPRPTPVTPTPRATLDSLRATTTGSQPLRTSTSSSQPIRAATGTTSRPSSRITPAFGTRLATPPSGSRVLPASPGKRGKRPAAARRSRWAKDLLQRFNFDDCA